MEEGSRKLRKRNSTKNDSFAINLLPPKNTYIYTLTPHTCAYVHMYVCTVCMCSCVCCKYVHMQSCLLHVCWCVCVQKRKRQLLQAFKCVYLYTTVYVHAHTQNASKVARKQYCPWLHNSKSLILVVLFCYILLMRPNKAETVLKRVVQDTSCMLLWQCTGYVIKV